MFLELQSDDGVYTVNMNQVIAFYRFYNRSFIRKEFVDAEGIKFEFSNGKELLIKSNDVDELHAAISDHISTNMRLQVVEA